MLYFSYKVSRTGGAWQGGGVWARSNHMQSLCHRGRSITHRENPQAFTHVTADSIPISRPLLCTAGSVSISASRRKSALAVGLLDSEHNWLYLAAQLLVISCCKKLSHQMCNSIYYILYNIIIPTYLRVACGKGGTTSS